MAENQEGSEDKGQDNNEGTLEVDEKVLHEAESQGWVPKDKYRGNETDWVDAETFVKRGREILPILRKNNENLIKELNHTKEQLKEFRQTAEEFKKFQKENYEHKAQEYEKQITELKVARAQAITDGDGQKVNALDDAIDEAKEGVKEAKASAKEDAKTVVEQPSSIDPVLQVWLDKHEWFGKDKKLTQMTNALGEVLRIDNPNLQGEKFLEALDEALLEEFPERFGKKKKAPAGQVESGSGKGRVSSSGKSYDNLPDDAKKACDRYVKQKLLTKEQYLAEYDWS